MERAAQRSALLQGWVETGGQQGVVGGSGMNVCAVSTRGRLPGEGLGDGLWQGNLTRCGNSCSLPS